MEFKVQENRISDETNSLVNQKSKWKDGDRISGHTGQIFGYGLQQENIRDFSLIRIGFLDRGSIFIST